MKRSCFCEGCTIPLKRPKGFSKDRTFRDFNGLFTESYAARVFVGSYTEIAVRLCTGDLQ